MGTTKSAPKEHRPTKEEKVDESIDESFPASDPPAHSGVTTGAPDKRDTPNDKE